MPAFDSTDANRAKEILRGTYVPPDEILSLAKRLKELKEFHLAWHVLAKAGRDPAADNQPALRLRLAQQQALCTYKDLELPAEQRYARALEILERHCDLAQSTNQETLGLAGAIHKYRWTSDAQPRHLELSLAYYLRGYEAGIPTPPDFDNGYTGINAAFALDQLASLEEADTRSALRVSDAAAGRRARAKEIRERLVATLSDRPNQPGNEWLANQWWFLVTVAEAHFGLANYTEAIAWLRKANALPNVPDWEKETTVRQLAALARLHESEDSACKQWSVFHDVFGISESAAHSIVAGKMGLALSGGGFRASLFHIGVLARLAEQDALRHVEVAVTNLNCNERWRNVRGKLRWEFDSLGRRAVGY